jgi:methionyl-tRNA synthetase
LSSFRDQLLEWVRQQSGWRQNVLNFTLRYLEDGLKDRAITRDIEWGVPVPQPGFEKKRIYVWFEAVIGYLSASKEWAGARGDDGGWADYWQRVAKSYYFIGKDNIPFHTMIWPAMLMGYGGLNLPDDVPANEFLTIEGKKLSTSRNWAVWLPDYLERYAPDPLRYLLSANMPESADADFSWREFVRRNNDELVATYGNLVHRVMTFTHRHFDGCVPVPGETDAADKGLLQKAEATVAAVDESLGRCRFREAIRAAMSLAQETNRYLDDKSPWKTIKTDRVACATALFISFAAISCLKTVLAPFLPFSSQRLHTMLGSQGRVGAEEWVLHPVLAGQKLGAAETLFTKLDESVVVEESSRLGNGHN